MASTALETLRQSLEDIDRLETGIVEVLGRRTRTHKERLEKEHEVAACLGAAQGLAKSAMDKFQDKDGLLREERATMTDGDVFSSFYTRLRDIREYHAKFTQDAELVKRNVLADVKPVMDFSGEESMGRFLDLHVFHEAYLNLPDVDRVDYKTYLDVFASLQSLPSKARASAAYRQYAQDLTRYLLSFVSRSQPLVDLTDTIKSARTAFDGSRQSSAGASGISDAQLASVASAGALEALGADVLKTALTARGLKSGGSLKERAERLFAVRGLTPDQYPMKFVVKGAVVTNGSSASSSTPAASTVPAAGGPEVASVPGADGLAGIDLVDWYAHLITVLAEVLSDVISETKARVIKKQTRTYAELVAEQDAENEVVVESEEDSDSDEDKPIYNPKNLPLGWDGKPIPYWLYKLHGLNQEFVCEICGDYSYWGRRNFDRHFQEPRHAYGMRRLGIPNTKHFHDVTSIKDAITLYQKLRTEIEAEAWKPEAEEEFEDTEGNVLSRKTYEDLARQGLL